MRREKGRDKNANGYIYVDIVEDNVRNKYVRLSKKNPLFFALN